MRVFTVPLLSHLRGLIRRAPNSRFYAVPALAWTNPKISHSEQEKEGNFDGKALELNEVGVLRVLTSMRDDPYLALAFLKRIEGNGALPSVQAYATVIRIVCSWSLDEKLGPFFMKLVRKGDEGRGFSVMDLLNAIGEAEEDEKVSFLLLSRVSSALVKAYANLEMFDEAIHLFWKMERLGLDADAHTNVVVVQALHRNEDIRGVEKFLNKLLSSETRNPRVFYMNFIEGLCLNQMAGIAYILLQPLRVANILVDIRDLAIAYRKVVRGLCNEMKIEDAESALLDMEECGIDPDVYVHSAIIEGHRKNMNIPKALDFFNKMVQRKRRINCVIASSILQCVSQMGMFSKAYHLFIEFREKNVSLDRVCYNVAFDALVKLGKVEEAIKLFREMTGEQGIAPDVVNYTTLIGGCCLHGKIHDAHDLMIEMEERGKTPDVVTYNVLAGGLARYGYVDEAFEILKAMEAQGVKPTSVTHKMVIQGLIVAGKTDEAEAFYESLGHEKSLENEASMVKGYCEAGLLDQAFERFIRVDFPLPKNVFFTLFTSLCAANDKDHIGKAEYLLDRMSQLIGVEPGKCMFGKLIGAWCRVDKVRKARKKFKVLVSCKKIIPDVYTYTTMINAYCRKDELKEAYALFQEMKQRRIIPDVVTYTVLLHHNPKWDMKREMKALGIKRDVHYYTVLIDRHCKTGELEDAERIFGEMIESGVEPDAAPYTALIARCCRDGYCKEAKRIFDLMIESGIKPDLVSYTTLIARCCRDGYLKEGKRIFDLMSENGIKPDLVSYTALIAGCYRNGSVLTAEKLMQEMLDKGIKPTNVFLSAVHHAKYKSKRLQSRE
ncbi:putative pentatricopeptide repeat-containing protein At1g13800 [Eutrema salsugineum]|uniref:putative pentatricopeptide repeat-containing protein At1g13800 n=1 Tax=Eutrema salsugineum TaxID=72664 RepID=UPI000CED07D6|nr:putative pentatricopeptide repeat-containing protein At1g13800 [Eutrema salsugineum]